MEPPSRLTRKFSVFRRFFAKRSRGAILAEFNEQFRKFEMIVNHLNTERQGLIDYDDLDGRFRYNGFDLNTDPLLRIGIKDLELDRVHTGRFLLCRLITGSYQITAVNTIIEDPEGHVERLSLHNWADPEISPAQNLLNRRCIPIGTIMVIRDPCYTVGADGYGVIVVKSAFDVIMIENYHPFLHGITWQSMSLPKPKLRKLKKFAVSSSQTVDSSTALVLQKGPFFIRTPLKPPSTRPKKRSVRREELSRAPSYNSKFNLKVMNVISSESIEENSTVILLSCFVFFIWLISCYN